MTSKRQDDEARDLSTHVTSFPFADAEFLVKVLLARNFYTTCLPQVQVPRRISRHLSPLRLGLRPGFIRFIKPSLLLTYFPFLKPHSSSAQQPVSFKQPAVLAASQPDYRGRGPGTASKKRPRVLPHSPELQTMGSNALTETAHAPFSLDAASKISDDLPQRPTLTSLARSPWTTQIRKCPRPSRFSVHRPQERRRSREHRCGPGLDERKAAPALDPRHFRRGFCCRPACQRQQDGLSRGSTAQRRGNPSRCACRRFSPAPARQ